MILLQLIYRFFMTGLFAVGGGLATLPFLYEMSNVTGWFTHADIADMIAISESTPGAIGINMSTYAGFTAAGVIGGLCASFGLALPSLIIILIIARILDKFKGSRTVTRIFYGLRPASIAMITAAGLNVARIALFNFPVFQESHNLLLLFNWKALLLAVLVFFGLRRLKWHPIVFLALSAVVGIIFKF